VNLAHSGYVSGRVGRVGDRLRGRLGLGIGRALVVEHRVEVGCELVHQLLADVAHDAATELRNLAGDVQGGGDDAARAWVSASASDDVGLMLRPPVSRPWPEVAW
jgi:hypothetical protein